MQDLKEYLSNKFFLIILMICFIFCFQVFNLFSNSKESVKVDYIKKEIIKINTDVDSIYKASKNLDKKLLKFNNEIKNINETINTNNSKIEKLKKDEKIKINKFKSYNARMYERYFTDRYSK